MASAQTRLSLRDAIALAVSRRPELRASSAKVESSGGLRRQAALRPNPRLILQSEDFHPSNFSFSFSQQSQTYAYASQVFEAPGKRNGRIAVADQAIERSKAQVDAARREMRTFHTFFAAQAQETSLLPLEPHRWLQSSIWFHLIEFASSIKLESEPDL